MRLLVVNPNTTKSMTEKIGSAARAVAAPGTEIVAVNPDSGPASIEGYYDEVFADPRPDRRDEESGRGRRHYHRLLRRHRARCRAQLLRPRR